MHLDLALVMPVYNEEACIAQVVRSWRDMLAGLGIRFRMIVLNDGSRDGTREALAVFEGESSITVIHKPNSGHGPTILAGYRQAVEIATWVFQCDSDDEMKPDHFPELWKIRDSYDALFGMRQGRQQNAARKLISVCSRLTVRVLFGKGVVDVNTPYRLMRADLLKQILPQIPDTTFAPNVIISGTLARAGARLCNRPVPHEGRRTGTVSIVKWKLWKSALRALWQTFRCRPKIEAKPAAGPPR
jgi:glycosyltransferase involved in cell wall biosynthesis